MRGNHETPSVWLLPISAGLMLLLAARHVYTHQQPLTRLDPPQTPARTPFAHSIAATGILEAASQNIAIGSALSGDRARSLCSGRKRGQRVKARRSAVSRRRSASASPARAGRKPAPRRPVAIEQAREISRGPRKFRPARPRCKPPRPMPTARAMNTSGPAALAVSMPCPSRRPSASGC